jgi:hypothetical protein
MIRIQQQLFQLRRLLFSFPSMVLGTDTFDSSRISSPHNPKIQPYSQRHIQHTAKYFPLFPPRLLVFDGQHEQFLFYGMNYYYPSYQNDTSTNNEYFEGMRYTARYCKAIPLMVQALLQQYPTRFQQGQPIFQLFFSDADSSSSPCVNRRHKHSKTAYESSSLATSICPVQDFSPILMFGSVPKDPTIFPTMKAFPHTVILNCLYYYKSKGQSTCSWPDTIPTDLTWDDLIPTLIWRGTDYPFLHHYHQFQFHGMEDIYSWLETSPLEISRDAFVAKLAQAAPVTPRWAAVLQSAILTENTMEQSSWHHDPWIDAKFVGTTMIPNLDSMLLSMYDISVTTLERMSPHTMAKYKYQIDLGGGGGTSWEGTLTKLQMPGVLFHHESKLSD